MSIDSTSPEQGLSSSNAQNLAQPNATTSNTETADKLPAEDASELDQSDDKEQKTPSAQSLLTSILSPLSSLLSSASPPAPHTQAGSIVKDSNAKTHNPESASNTQSQQDSSPEALVASRPSSTNSTDRKDGLSPIKSVDTTSSAAPEPYYAPAQVPAFKALQKKRLTGTRTKQLLRAAGRAHDDPPPPPELGLCCGSSCDPCVNDLWREELSVWKERWGGRGVEGGVTRKELEW